MKRCIKNKKRFSQKDIECVNCKDFDKCLQRIENQKAIKEYYLKEINNG
jgi:bifunctional N-acetylglucosamine-1-phosphate-uridyltransferase/glucosamine-1-phosphate-acetyltransferase GlmU-like protein